MNKYDDIRARLDRGDCEVVCLCGSTRFMDAYERAIYEFTLEGIIILSVGVSKYFAPDHGAEAIGPDCADMLDELHLRKIDMADRIHVLNVGGYVGPSTRREIEYAIRQKTQVTWLEPDKIPPWAGRRKT